MPHKHAKLMMQYAEDAAETDQPWERWECRNAGFGDWGPVAPPVWMTNVEYRRKAPKPERVKVNFYRNPAGDVLMQLAGSVSDQQRESLSRYTRITPDFGDGNE